MFCRLTDVNVKFAAIGVGCLVIVQFIVRWGYIYPLLIKFCGRDL